MEECTFHPTISNSTRTLQQTRRQAQEAKMQKMSEEMKMLETVFPEDENSARPRKGEVFDNLYRNALEMQIKWKHPAMKTTEEKEIETHCTFTPNINNSE